jgi:succinate dehydrogenase / fumarate reductase membrane anchor subunit
MTVYTRTGRAKPSGADRVELAAWYLMRLTGLGLFVLALSHFLITHVLFDPANQTAEWIATHRWANDLWRYVDGTLLVLVVFHSFVGVRTVMQDYIGGRLRTVLLVVLAVAGVGLAFLGLWAVASAAAPPP